MFDNMLFLLLIVLVICLIWSILMAIYQVERHMDDSFIWGMKDDSRKDTEDDQ